MLTRTLILLLSIFPIATFAGEELHEVVMFAAHQSQCTRGNSKCVGAITEYVNSYFEPPEERDGFRRDLFTCTGHGECDDRVGDFLLCVFMKGCQRRRHLKGSTKRGDKSRGNGRDKSRGDGRDKSRGNGEEKPDMGVVVPPDNEECYLAGDLEDLAFKNDIIMDLGDECPCIRNTNFYVRICEYADL